jgi:hypothetical protein
MVTDRKWLREIKKREAAENKQLRKLQRKRERKQSKESGGVHGSFLNTGPPADSPATTCERVKVSLFLSARDVILNL